MLGMMVMTSKLVTVNYNFNVHIIAKWKYMSRFFGQ